MLHPQLNPGIKNSPIFYSISRNEIDSLPMQPTQWNMWVKSFQRHWQETWRSLRDAGRRPEVRGLAGPVRRVSTSVGAWARAWLPCVSTAPQWTASRMCASSSAARRPARSATRRRGSVSAASGTAAHSASPPSTLSSRGGSGWVSGGCITYGLVGLRSVQCVRTLRANNIKSLNKKRRTGVCSTDVKCCKCVW